MAIKVTLTHTRQSVETAWFEHSSEFTQKIEDMKANGTLTSFDVNQDNNLLSIVTIVYPDEASRLAWETDSFIDTFYQSMLLYHSANNITETVSVILI